MIANVWLSISGVVILVVMESIINNYVKWHRSYYWGVIILVVMESIINTKVIKV